MYASKLTEAELGDLPRQQANSPCKQIKFLKEGEKVIIAGLVMKFYYWRDAVPVFTFNMAGTQFNFSDNSYTAEDFLTLILD